VLKQTSSTERGIQRALPHVEDVASISEFHSRPWWRAAPNALQNGSFMTAVRAIHTVALNEERGATRMDSGQRGEDAPGAGKADPVGDAEKPAARDGEGAPEIPAAGLGAFVKGAAREYAILIGVFSAAINLLHLAPSLYMLQVYDRVLSSGGLLTLALLSVVAVFALGVLASLDTLRARVIARLSLKLEEAFASRVALLNFRARARGENQDQSAIRDLDNLRQGISAPGVVALLDVPWTPLFLLTCFLVHVSVGLAATAGAAMIFALAVLNERASRASIDKVTDVAPRFYGGVEADLRMADAARALGMEDRLIARRMGARQELVLAQTEAAFINAHYSSAARMLRMLLQSAMLGLGAYLAVIQQISPGAIIAVTILTARAFAPIEQVVSSWRQTRQTWSAYRSLRGILDAAAVDPPRTKLPPARGEVDLEGVSVRHPGSGRPALLNVSFRASPGAIVGIIGPSGAGKTSLVRVIANAMSPTSGGVRLDRARYEDWPRDDLAGSIGYLPQSIDLLQGTVAQNISRFEPDPDSASIARKVIEAAQAAGAHELILGLPNAYETVIGPGGAGLSHGQLQRIGIARALYGDPAVLVLDEPNAHLDDEGESKLIAALTAARARNATAFVVAHRARLLTVADTLLVLKDGVVVQAGPREQVLAKLAAASGATPVAALARGQA
jgi:PrtD family type I secretion system ABC transporter